MNNYRVIIPGALHHIYQRSVDGGLLFYSAGDYLAYYTIAMTRSRKHGVELYGLSLMYDHVHAMVRASDAKTLARYVGDVNRTYTNMMNLEAGRKGPLFHKGYGCAPRIKLKDIRSSLIYLFNNQVEKRICETALESRWNFLAYYFSPNPYSKPLIMRHASAPMRKAVNVIKHMAERYEVLSPTWFRNQALPLNPEERAQLIDLVITQYMSIDTQGAISLWDNKERMVEAINSTTGKEFDIGEKVDRSVSDAIYPKIINLALSSRIVEKPEQILSLAEEDKMRLARLISARINAPSFQISKCLHLPYLAKH